MKLTLITGKGGVGKSTVSAALATALSACHQRVGIVGLGISRMQDFFPGKRPTYQGTQADPNITLFHIEAPACFEEYIEQTLSKPLQLVLKNRYVHHFIDAIPGLNEILLLGKITAMMEENNFDHLLIDAPATGHTIALCEAPKIALGALSHGPLKTTVQKILDQLYHFESAGFLLVTQPEEFIVDETLELYLHLTQYLHLHFKGMIFNALPKNRVDLPAGFPKDIPAVAKPLQRILQMESNRQKRQDKLKKTLQNKIKKDFMTLSWHEDTLKESQLKKDLAKEMRPWISKNF